MQGNPNDRKAETTPVACGESQRLKVAVSWALNGKAHELDTEMQGVEHRETRSLLAHTLMD